MKIHPLIGTRKSLDHRAKIAASKVMSALDIDDEEEYQRRWQAEYDVALFRLKRMQELSGEPIEEHVVPESIGDANEGQ